MKIKALLLSCAVLLAGGPALAQDKEITVQIWGSTWENGIKAISQQFEAETGIRVNAVTQSSSGEGLVKLQAERSKPSVDVWFATNTIASEAGQDQELFVKIPQDKLTNKDELIQGAISDDWVGIYYYPMGIVYDADVVSVPPTSWEDLWKPEYKSQIIAPAMSIYSGSLLMVANQLNGGSTENFDPGFEALKTLNDNVSLYYSSDSQARQSIVQGEGSILIGQSSHMNAIAKEGLNMKMVAPKPAPLYFDVMMMTNGDSQEEAAAFINYIISKGAQEEMLARVNMAPVNKNVALPEELAAALPADGDGFVMDGKLVNDNVSDWTVRFDEIAR
ncbi:MAG: extracellular solute-binding protein family 1 [Devosia sp.]|nr:extracellular solute-binding protein family 1 [Devosia sp.]